MKKSMLQDESFSLTNDNFAWWFSFIGVISLLILLPIIKTESIIPLYKFIYKGIPATLFATILGICFASLIGLVVGIGRVWNKILNRILSIYVEVIRGIPLLVQLVYVYFVFGKIFHINRFTAAVFALSICYGAYMAEIVRAGLMSIPKGQIEAAKSLGMSKRQIFTFIIIPQAIRIILPPYGNEFIAMLKDSSLVSVIAVSDIMQKARQYTSVHFNYFETFTVAALIYLLLTLFFSKVIFSLEKSLLPKYQTQGVEENGA